MMSREPKIRGCGRRDENDRMRNENFLAVSKDIKSCRTSKRLKETLNERKKRSATANGKRGRKKRY